MVQTLDSFSETQLIDKRTINLDELFSDEEQRLFRERLERFLASDVSASEIVKVSGNMLTYDSESYIPHPIDPGKPNLMLILGNPAPESVSMNAMFAYESSGKRSHRFWQVLDTTGVLRFGQDDPSTIDPHDKMRRLYNGDYNSPSNVFILPFYSFATPPGGPWGGVLGIRRLFGSGFSRLEALDARRICAFFDKHVTGGDTILVFQKDAFVALTCSQHDAPPYDYRSLLSQPIISSYTTAANATARLMCMLPTRLLHSSQTKNVLASLASERPLPNR